jgi:2-keto-3-deoxy-L-arabinonate dehydratase
VYHYLDSDLNSDNIEGVRPVRLEGVVPILMTPVLDGGEIAWSDLEREVDFLLGQGVAAYGFGFGSEVFRLTEAERDTALEVVVRQTAGRASVIANVLAGSTPAAVERAEAAKAIGADAIMLPPPQFGPPDQQALFHHYATVAAEVGSPIVVQDAPGMSGLELSADLLLRLAHELEQVVALKVEAEPSAPKIDRIVRALDGDVSVLGGGAGLDLLHELERGAHGTMPGAALADAFLRVWRLHRDGRDEEARREFERLLPLLVLGLRSMDTFLFVEKEILRRRGVFTSAQVRLPAPAPEPALVAEVTNLLDRFEASQPTGLNLVGAEPPDLTSEVI